MINSVLTLLARENADWRVSLAADVVFEALGITLQGRDSVAARLAATPFHRLFWKQLDRPGIVLSGTARPGHTERGLVISLLLTDGRISRFSQQNAPLPPRPEAPMVMDAALRERFDRALAEKHPMALAYVDDGGKPHLSLRGSIRTFGPDRLCLWARSATHGLAAASKSNPQVALLFRDESARATYQLQGRAHVAADEATRAAVFEGCPVIEQQHDFARLGAAVIIELDLVEGYAGLGPSGQVDPVRLVRPRDYLLGS
jgi:hypothetical protein